jgi:hypothetical protein
MPRNGSRLSAVGAFAVLVAGVGGSSSAQEQAPRSARAYCLKVASEKAVEFESFVGDVGIPLERSRVAAGESKGFDLLRAVVPLGAEARCDYVAVFHYGLLPEALPTDRMGEHMKRAGLDQPVEQAMEKWDALTDLVSLEWWWFAERVGPAWPKGSYVNINYYKIRANGFDDYLAAERTYWKPMVEAYRAAGKKVSWDLVGLWAPFRADGYQGMTFDVFHDWATMMESQSAFTETWPKVNPGLSFALVEELKQSVRVGTHSALFRVVQTTTE